MTQRPSGAKASAAALPSPERLAAVATVLCVYPARHRGLLDGWLDAAQAQRLLLRDDSGRAHEGPGFEGLGFATSAGRSCWRLYLLPDSDFLAWDDLTADWLPAAAPAPSSRLRRLWASLPGAGALRRLTHRLRGGWNAEVIRLHVLHDEAGHCILVADTATPSALGFAHAQRIAQAEGAALRTAPHACCCMASMAQHPPAQYA